MKNFLALSLLFSLPLLSIESASASGAKAVIDLLVKEGKVLVKEVPVNQAGKGFAKTPFEKMREETSLKAASTDIAETLIDAAAGIKSMPKNTSKAMAQLKEELQLGKLFQKKELERLVYLGENSQGHHVVVTAVQAAVTKGRNGEFDYTVVHQSKIKIAIIGEDSKKELAIINKYKSKDQQEEKARELRIMRFKAPAEELGLGSRDFESQFDMYPLKTINGRPTHSLVWTVNPSAVNSSILARLISKILK